MRNSQNINKVKRSKKFEFFNIKKKKNILPPQKKTKGMQKIISIYILHADICCFLTTSDKHGLWKSDSLSRNPVWALFIIVWP